MVATSTSFVHDNVFFATAVVVRVWIFEGSLLMYGFLGNKNVVMRHWTIALFWRNRYIEHYYASLHCNSDRLVHSTERLSYIVKYVCLAYTESTMTKS